MSSFPGDLIYRLVIFFLRMAQPEFFRRIQIEGEPLDDDQEFLMVVANHPYGIQDAFLISIAYTRPFYFVATALNFQRRDGDTIKIRPLRSWILRQCKVLPIVRDRSEGDMSENMKTFEAAAEQIVQGHALGIFAEGDSRGNQWGLLKLKSGSAQIALQVADALKDRGRKLNIQVVGLTYTNWEHPFKSSVTLRFAEPFVVEPVDMVNRGELRAARKAITSRLTETMTAHTVQIPEKHRALAGKIAQFYTVHRRSDYERLRIVGQKLEQLDEQFADERKEVEEKLDEYLKLADELKIYPGEERVRRNRLLLLAAAGFSYIGYVLHLPILWATVTTVPRSTTPLHSLGDKRVTWGIVFTLAWYLLIGTLSCFLAAWRYGLRGFALGFGLVVGVALCGVIASRCFRHVNMLLRTTLPSRRRFKRYRELGEELYQQFEHYRRTEKDASR